MKRDMRDPEVVGKALLEMKKTMPNMSASQRADLLWQLSYSHTHTVISNGNGK